MVHARRLAGRDYAKRRRAALATIVKSYTNTIDNADVVEQVDTIENQLQGAHRDRPSTNSSDTFRFRETGAEP